MSAASSSSASAPATTLPRIAAASAASSSGPAAAVTVEDESTKRCSACLEDRPESAYSSAQLKKKGKRVCSHCVARKAGAASAQQEAAAQAAAKARKDAMKDAFATRLNAVTPQATAATCLCCKSKAVVRFVACIRCSVPCCSLKCFDGHDCDTYLEAARTMPAAQIPEEDRFASVDELQSLWSSFSNHLRSLPASVSNVILDLRLCRSDLAKLREMESDVHRTGWSWSTIRQVYSPCVAEPWWSPDCCKRLNAQAVHPFLMVIPHRLTRICFRANNILRDCALASNSAEFSTRLSQMIRGLCQRRITTQLTSGCLLPGRLLHKLMTLLIFIMRAVPSSWLKAEFGPSQVESDLFGLLPPFSPGDKGLQLRLGYVQHEDQQTGEHTLVPLVGPASTTHKASVLQQHLGYKTLLMGVQAGRVLLDRGVCLMTGKATGLSVLSAASGWTGRVSDSFTAAPAEMMDSPTGFLNALDDDALEGDQELMRLIREELAARKRPDYFHIIPAMRSIVSEQDWPSASGSSLFIATPQPGLESELVELELLESLVEEAALGNEQTQRLIAHIEGECNRINTQDALVDSAESVQPSSPGAAETSQHAPLTIADIVAAKRASMQRMIDEQLLIHAEAVNRAQSRRRINADRVAGDASDSSASAPTASAAAGPSSSAFAPTSAASSASSSSSSQLNSTDVVSASGSLSAGSSSLLPAVAAASDGTDGIAYSWTSAYSTLESMREPGRKQYRIITSAALRFLHTLRPVSVNRSGGSHTVFHFASGKPVTLVQPHGGDGSVSRHKATRLYAVLHEAALQQLSPAEALPSAGSGRRAALTEAAL